MGHTYLLCYLTSQLFIKNEKSAHVNPQPTSQSLQFVLHQPTISGFVIPGVVAILEDCCFNVVPLFFAFQQK